MSEILGGAKAEEAVAGNGTGPAASRFCAFCGRAVVDAASPARFGEVFCAEGHAEEFAAGVRAARVAAAAAPPDVQPAVPETAIPPTEAAAAVAATPAGAPPAKSSVRWTTAVKMAACCGLPILGLIILAGGGAALLGAAGAVVPLLLALACPIGMFFMMRMMMKGGGHDKSAPRDGER